MVRASDATSTAILRQGPALQTRKEKFSQQSKRPCFEAGFTAVLRGGSKGFNQGSKRPCFDAGIMAISRRGSKGFSQRSRRPCFETGESHGHFPPRPSSADEEARGSGREA
jgi:hypothetical protein